MILYKYCDQFGGTEIIGSLELKLPFISEVNDPLECLPIFCCEGEKSKVKERCLLAFKRKQINIGDDLLKNLDKKIENGEMQELLKKQSRVHVKEWNDSKGCLLSVSKTARNTVMWAHYAEKHKGIVIGIDFQEIFQKNGEQIGVVMEPVKYSKDRIKIDISTDETTKEWRDAMSGALLNKSKDWQYEQEFRTIFLDDMLKDWRRQGMACFKELKGKITWFLKLHPSSIKEIIFGLFAEESLKNSIRKLKSSPGLKHVKLYNVAESDSYDFNLIEEKI